MIPKLTSQCLRCAIFLLGVLIFYPSAHANQSVDTLEKDGKLVTTKDETKKKNTLDSEQLLKQRMLKEPITVTQVYHWGHPEDTSKKVYAAMGDILVLRVKGYSKLIGRVQGIIDQKGDTVNTGKKQNIALFLDGRPITNLQPESGAPQPDSTPQGDYGIFQFHLQRNASNDEVWADLLGNPKNGNLFYRPTKISLGLENEYPVESIANPFSLVRIHHVRFYVCLFGLVLYIFILIYLGKRSNILRDRGVDTSPVNIIRTVDLNPYSLGRFQMAFWFSLVLASFLFIWAITGTMDILTGSVLAMIGISAGTALGAITIGQGKEQDVLSQTQGLIAEQAALTDSINTLNLQINQAMPPPDLATLQTTLATQKARFVEVQEQITSNKNLLQQDRSRGFFMDLLSDGSDGVSFHRLQMLVWTIVFGFIFIIQVWTRLSMPEFSPTLLALQGITAGTYLGFKFPEKV